MIMLIILVILTKITIITSATCICYYIRSRVNYLLYFYNHHILHRQDGYHFYHLFIVILFYSSLFSLLTTFNNYTLMLTWRDGLYIPTLALYCKLHSLISISTHRYVNTLAIYLYFHIFNNMYIQVVTKTLQAILPTTCKKGRKMGKIWQKMAIKIEIHEIIMCD